MSETAAAAVTTESPNANAVASEPANTSAPAPNEAGAIATSKEVFQRIQRGESPAPKPSEPSQPEVTADATPSTDEQKPPVKPDEKGNLHGPDGKFVAKDGAEPETAQAVEPTTPATPEVPAGFVKIELPEGHPLRERGRTHIVAPEAEEADYRGIVGAAARRAEVEALQTEIRQRDERILRFQAQEEARQKYANDPDIRELDARIAALEGVDPLTADALKHRREALLGEKAEGRYNDMAREQWVGTVQQAGDHAEAQAFSLVTQRYPADWLRTPAAQQVWQDATDTYIAKARRSLRPGEAPRFDAGEIVREFDLRAIHDPTIRSQLTARMQQEREAEQKRIAAAAEDKAKADRAEAERKQMEENLQKRKNNPLGRLAVGTSTGQTVPTERALTSKEYIQSVVR